MAAAPQSTPAPQIAKANAPILPGRRYEEWVLPDPAGQTLDAIRPMRDEIEQRVQTLLVTALSYDDIRLLTE